jgi:methylisocitrate lyase
MACDALPHTAAADTPGRQGGLPMSLRALMQGPLPVTAPLVLNPLMAKMAEAAGFRAGYLGGGSTGYLKVVLEANLNVTEMCQAAVDIRAVSSLALILDGACGYGDPMHLHRTIGMSEAAGFAGIEIEDQLVPKRAHHHVGVEHMIPVALMAAKVREAVAARRSPEFVVIARTNAMRASTMDDALRRGEAYRTAGADVVLLSMAHEPEQLRTIARHLGGPLMYLTRRGGLAGLGMSLKDLGDLGYRIVADPSTALIAAYATWKTMYADLADGFATGRGATADWAALEQDMFRVIGLEKLLAVERATVEGGRPLTAS